jgi:putative hemolysin
MDSFFIIVVSILFSAFFSGIEIAFVTANRLKLELDSKQGSVNARIISFFLQRPSYFITAMLVGNNIALVVYGVYMGNALVQALSSFVVMSDVFMLVSQTVISTLIILFTAEFTPKILFRINPNSTLYLFAFPLVVLTLILFIPTIIIIGISKLLIKVFFSSSTQLEAYNFGKLDLDLFLRESAQNSNNLEEVDHEVQIFQKALNFHAVKARDCMIPRTEIEAVDIEDSIDGLKDKFINTGLSKIMIYREDIDNIIGYAHSYELFKNPENIKSILLPVNVLPETMPASEVLKQLIGQKRSIAVVVDEFGGTAGIITIEDVMEQIFGEIDDEYDTEGETEEKISENEYLLSARLEINYLNDKYKLNLPVAESYETLAGLIMDRSGDIPSKNEQIQIDQLLFTIEKATGTKIELVKVELLSDS